MAIKNNNNNQKNLIQLSNLFESLPNPAFLKGLDGLFLGCNDAFIDFLGLSREEVLGKSVTEIIPEQFATIHTEFDQLVLANGESRRYEAKIATARGNIRNYVIHKAAYENEENEVVGLIGIITDITDRVRIEEARKLDESRLETLLKLSQISSEASLKEITDFSLDEAIRLTGSDIGYLAFLNENESVLSMYSWSKKAMDLCQINQKQIDYRIHETGLWGEAVRQRKPIIINNYQLPNPLKKGCPKGHIQIKRHMNIPVFEGEQMVAVAGVGNKETDYNAADLRQLSLLMQGMWSLIQRKNSEEERLALGLQLQQAQKMESIGRLAGEIAHDFNNMLSVIIGRSEMALEGIEAGSPLYHELECILNAGRHSADLTRKLLAFARKQQHSPEVIDVNEVLGCGLEIIKRLIGEEIRISWNPGKDIWPIRIDPIQVEQILTNLSINASDAINGVGQITISTNNILIKEEDCLYDPEFMKGEFVEIKFGDSGCGIESKNLESIFEPFFTTKESGKGTGLGLSTIYGIVKQNNGLIVVQSEKDKGSEFKIYLPRHSYVSTS